MVVGVRFRPAGRIYYYNPGGHTLTTGQWVIVESAKGVECGRVVIAPKQVAASEVSGDGLKPVQRVASEDDLRQMLSFKSKEKDALQAVIKALKEDDSIAVPLQFVNYR